MSSETYYITPNEAALAVVATSMKKARLKLDVLIINSIVGGILFSAGGMLHVFIQAESPYLYEECPGIVKLLQGVVFPIGLFCVVIMGAELFNSNIMYYTVGVCRGAVSIFDLLISWTISWLFNLGSTLFVCFVICKLGGIATSERWVNASVETAIDKVENYTFVETLIKGIAGNFCVCLGVYLQLLAKPIHVKWIMISLPVFTFVTIGFTNVIADMYLIPMGLINGAPVSVGRYIWRTLVSGTLGNIIGGIVFSVAIPFYLHLVTVERDRKLLKLPQSDVRDEQPELEMDSRVIRVPTHKESAEEDDDNDNDSSTFGSDSYEKLGNDQINPVSYRPLSTLSRVKSRVKSRADSKASSNKKVRSPPGVFPVLGMGKPLTRERTIADNNTDIKHGEEEEEEEEEDDDDDRDKEAGISDISSTHLGSNPGVQSIRSRSFSSESSKSDNLKKIQQIEEDEYAKSGGYNARENNLGESLKRLLSRPTTTNEMEKSSYDLELGMASGQPTPTKSRLSVSSLNNSGKRNSISNIENNKLFKTISRSFSKRQPETAGELYDNLSKYNITPRAAFASDNIAGVDGYLPQDGGHILQRPSLAKVRNSSYHSLMSQRKRDSISQNNDSITRPVQSRKNSQTSPGNDRDFSTTENADDLDNDLSSLES
ncbi:hypothetical protein WICMUC_001306 [Wickerhamomyces mucosus]|uniref:Formate/nitrite transporter n=1 Tax=Wickerhamomyces mucosus TaxID=1378264 RepID=A0A9P8PV50_9ASCO|nr:hypothetical protein WICMUC_001306 [Wickerhamomyces mucosus]